MEIILLVRGVILEVAIAIKLEDHSQPFSFLVVPRGVGAGKWVASYLHLAVSSRWWSPFFWNFRAPGSSYKSSACIVGFYPHTAASSLTGLRDIYVCEEVFVAIFAAHASDSSNAVGSGLRAGDPVGDWWYFGDWASCIDPKPGLWYGWSWWEGARLFAASHSHGHHSIDMLRD